jgi:prephenate dehydrogenase
MARDAEPPFPHVAIVGFGLIGGSLGLAIRERWPKAMVIAIDRKPVIETAMRLGAADVGGDDLGLAAGAELIVLAAPVVANLDVLAELDGFVPGAALVTDVSSTKRAIAQASHTLPSRLHFIGGHPLAGAATSGVEAARADLFAGRPWILTPERTPPDTTLVDFLEALGAKVETMTPDAHDELLAYISHLPQLTASALMSIVGGKAGARGLAHAGRGLRDTTRLASSPPEIWRDIAATNRDHLTVALDELIGVLQNLKDDLSGDRGVMDTLFASAAEWKRILEEPFDT